MLDPSIQPCTDLFLQIALFVALFMLSLCPFDISVGVWAFVIGLSQISSFLSLTNKAVGTIWRALSKPPQRRQIFYLRPLWLLVGTPSAIRPELASRRAEHSLPYLDVTIYFLLYIIYHLCFTCIDFYDLSAWGGCCLFKEVHIQFFKRMSFWLHGYCGAWEGWARKLG